ncbi:hypothetical protein [Streptomyces griseomycini]|uniref:Uncharacterized protein n=1 Tax=Streptomyces griseomycini TaxID=66895 RepID=A0A7W7LWB5_9ACTN|nr:hypothetical protein [Streptomyces griseomycini]MBB4897640.1 hypothetical protein [Streptomyces griseomycini]GGR12435.1 hypothetical protein GCM10015536_17540 [Streptomyces griseomycini]
MYPEPARPAPAERAVTAYQPTPIPPATVHPAPVVPVQPTTVPAVASIVLPDGRVVTGYAVDHPQPAPIVAKPAVSRAAVNVALGSVGFLAVCGGLLLLTSFIAALTAFITQLITLAAVIFGGWIAVQLFTGTGHRDGGTTVNIHKAVFKRNHFRG